MPYYPADTDPQARAKIVAALQARYDHWSEATFILDAQGRYPPLGPGNSQAILDWVYPAMHLILEPRAGRENADRELGRKMLLRAIRQGQCREPGHLYEGIWHWSITDETGPNPKSLDRNTGGFMGCGLVRIWANDPQKLNDWPAEDMELFKDAVRRSVAGGLRHWVRVSYTNPQCLDFYLCWVAADLLGDPGCREHTRPHLEQFLAHARMNGSFEEWISPTYVAVNLTALVPLAHYARGTPDERLFRDLLDFQWRLVGAAAHGPTQEICGPHSRAYGDTALERADHAYAWLHLAAPEVFRLEALEREVENGSFYRWFQDHPAPFEGLAAPGLYVPLQIPEDVQKTLRSSFAKPVEGREIFEWIGRCGWKEPYCLTRPASSEPAPRFRMGTRFRTARFCLGSVNELDGWLQRRPCLAYWKDAEGRTTGLKFHVRVEIDPSAGAAGPLSDWLLMQAVEFISVQSGAEVLGTYRMAPVVAAQPGDVLGTPAVTATSKIDKRLDPKQPLAWFLGTHWRQSIEPEQRRQAVARLWVGVTPLGKGTWTALDPAHRKWAFVENGVEALLETPFGARIVERPHLTKDQQAVPCLELWSAENFIWDWLALPAMWAPFGLSVQEAGTKSNWGLTVSGTGSAGELSRGDLRVKWRATSRPNEIEQRTWWGWKGTQEIVS